MAIDNQSLGMQLGLPVYGLAGGGPLAFDTKSDFWKQQISPWDDYYSKVGAQSVLPEGLAGAVGRKVSANPPVAPGDVNSPAAQFAKASFDYNKTLNEEGTLGGSVMGRMGVNGSLGPANALNDQFLKLYANTLSPELQKVFNSPVASMEWGKKSGLSKSDLIGYTNNLINELSALSNNGYNIKTKSGDTMEQIKRLAPDLARYGVSSLNDLVAYKVKSPYTGKNVDIFYNTKTGTVIPTKFGSSMKGEGGSNYQLYNYNGKAIPLANWKDTSEAADYAPLVMMASVVGGLFLGPVAASIGQGIVGAGASTGATALATGAAHAALSGTLSGTLAAASGGDFGKGFLTGAVGSGIGSAVGYLNPGSYLGGGNVTIGNAINKAISGGLSSAAGAAISGGDAGMGALRGFVSGGVAGLTAPLVGGLSGSLGSLAGGLIGTGGAAGQAAAPKTTAPTQTATAAPDTTGYGSGQIQDNGLGYGAAGQLVPRRGLGFSKRA